MASKLKVETYEKCTIPVLTYGARTGTVTNNQLRKIGSTQMAMERAILRVKRKDRIRNAKIRMESKAKDYRYVAKKLKMGYTVM